MKPLLRVQRLVTKEMTSNGIYTKVGDKCDFWRRNSNKYWCQESSRVNSYIWVQCYGENYELMVYWSLHWCQVTWGFWVIVDTLLTFTMLAYYMLRYSRKCAPGSSMLTLQWKSQEPMLIEQCFNISNTFPQADESGESDYGNTEKKLFYMFWRLKSPMEW